LDLILVALVLVADGKRLAVLLCFDFLAEENLESRFLHFTRRKMDLFLSAIVLSLESFGTADLDFRKESKFSTPQAFKAVLLRDLIQIANTQAALPQV
jgi:hypothetical protein